jgi:hypothetical protein
LNDIKIDADRRRDLTEFNEHYQHDAKPYRIDTVLQYHGEKQRHRYYYHAQPFKQAAENRIEQEHCKKERGFAQVQSNQERGHLLADAGSADGIGKDVRGKNYEEDIAQYRDRASQRGDESAP